MSQPPRRCNTCSSYEDFGYDEDDYVTMSTTGVTSRRHRQRQGRRRLKPGEQRRGHAPSNQPTRPRSSVAWTATASLTRSPNFANFTAATRSGRCSNASRDQPLLAKRASQPKEGRRLVITGAGASSGIRPRGRAADDGWHGLSIRRRTRRAHLGGLEISSAMLLVASALARSSSWRRQQQRRRR